MPCDRVCEQINLTRFSPIDKRRCKAKCPASKHWTLKMVRRPIWAYKALQNSETLINQLL